jgi:hypothetical protein
MAIVPGVVYRLAFPFNFLTCVAAGRIATVNSTSASRRSPQFEIEPARTSRAPRATPPVIFSPKKSAPQATATRTLKRSIGNARNWTNLYCPEVTKPGRRAGKSC